VVHVKLPIPDFIVLVLEIRICALKRLKRVRLKRVAFVFLPRIRIPFYFREKKGDGKKGEKPSNLRLDLVALLAAGRRHAAGWSERIPPKGVFVFLHGDEPHEDAQRYRSGADRDGDSPVRQAQASRLCVVAEKLNKDDLDDGRDDNDEEKHRVGREPGKSGFPVVADAPRVEFVEDLAKDKGIEDDRVVRVVGLERKKKRAEKEKKKAERWMDK
jgi:hypothetical protein